MKNKIYIAIICAFSIVFAVSSGFLIKHYDYMIFKKNHHHAKGGVDNV